MILTRKIGGAGSRSCVSRLGPVEEEAVQHNVFTPGQFGMHARTEFNERRDRTVDRTRPVDGL